MKIEVIMLKRTAPLLVGLAALFSAAMFYCYIIDEMYLIFSSLLSFLSLLVFFLPHNVRYHDEVVDVLAPDFKEHLARLKTRERIVEAVYCFSTIILLLVNLFPFAAACPTLAHYFGFPVYDKFLAYFVANFYMVMWMVDFFVVRCLSVELDVEEKLDEVAVKEEEEKALQRQEAERQALLEMYGDDYTTYRLWDSKIVFSWTYHFVEIFGERVPFAQIRSFRLEDEQEENRVELSPQQAYKLSRHHYVVYLDLDNPARPTWRLDCEVDGQRAMELLDGFQQVVDYNHQY